MEGEGTSGSKSAPHFAIWTTKTRGESRPFWRLSPQVVDSGASARVIKGVDESRRELWLSSNESEELGFRRQSDVLLGSFAIAKNHDSGNSAHTELPSSQGSFIDVQFSDDSFIAQLLRNLIDDGSELPTRTAPRRREVDQHGFVALEDSVLEIEIVEDLDVFGCHDFCNITPVRGSARRSLFLLENAWFSSHLGI